MAQAFVGYDSQFFPPGKWVHSANGFVTGTCFSFLGECPAWNLFFLMWQSNFTLDECIDYTSVDHPPYPFQFDDLSKFNFGEYQDRCAKDYLADEDNIHPRLKVFGYSGLTRFGFAPGHDRSPHYGNSIDPITDY